MQTESIPTSLTCTGCGKHYLFPHHAMSILGEPDKSAFYKLPIPRHLHGTIRCDELKRYQAGEVFEPELGRTSQAIFIRPSPGFVYLLRWREFYKIGLSGNPTRRLQAINCVRSPDTEPVVLMHQVFVMNTFRAERRLHEQFAPVRLPNPWREWFRLSGEDVRHICLLKDGDLDEPK